MGVRDVDATMEGDGRFRVGGGLSPRGCEISASGERIFPKGLTWRVPDNLEFSGARGRKIVNGEFLSLSSSWLCADGPGPMPSSESAKTKQSSEGAGDGTDLGASAASERRCSSNPEDPTWTERSASKLRLLAVSAELHTDMCEHAEGGRGSIGTVREPPTSCSGRSKV